MAPTNYERFGNAHRFTPTNKIISPIPEITFKWSLNVYLFYLTALEAIMFSFSNTIIHSNFIIIFRKTKFLYQHMHRFMNFFLQSYHTCFWYVENKFEWFHFSPINLEKDIKKCFENRSMIYTWTCFFFHYR